MGSILCVPFWDHSNLGRLVLANLTIIHAGQIRPIRLGSRNSYKALIYLGAIRVMEWHLCHIENSMITTVWSHLQVFLKFKVNKSLVKIWILLKTVLARDVIGSLHFPLPSMNRLDQTEPAAYAILLFWLSLGFFFSVFQITLVVLYTPFWHWKLWYSFEATYCKGI